VLPISSVLNGALNLKRLKNTAMQAGFDIHCLGIRGFDYSRTQKAQIMRENCQCEAKVA